MFLKLIIIKYICVYFDGSRVEYPPNLVSWQVGHFHLGTVFFCLPLDLGLSERDSEKFHIFQQLVWTHPVLSGVSRFRKVHQNIYVSLSSLVRFALYSSISYLFLSLPNKNYQLSFLAELSRLSGAVKGKPADFAKSAK